MRRAILAVIGAVVCIAAAPILACADTLYLVNGRSIEGIVRNEDNGGVELEVSGGSVTFKRSEITRIGKSSPGDSAALRRKWETQRRESLARAVEQKIKNEQAPKHIAFNQEEQSILLDVTINGIVKAKLLLDTGSSLVVLKKDVAERLGIAADPDHKEAHLILADGRKLPTKQCVLESVAAQGAEAYGVECALILTETPEWTNSDGLLGMSFLKYFNFKVDQQNKRLILERVQ